MAEVQITIQDIDASGKAAKSISFVGQLDETNVDEEAKKIYQVIEEMPEPNLLLDFSDLAYMNSKSIGYVTDWYSRVAAKNGRVVIARPRANILDILKVVGITQIVNIYDSVEEAKAAFSGAAPEVTPTPAPTETPAPPAADTAPAPADTTPAPPAADTAPAPADTTPAPEVTPTPTSPEATPPTPPADTTPAPPAADTAPAPADTTPAPPAAPETPPAPPAA